jgi:hypothetical protein
MRLIIGSPSSAAIKHAVVVALWLLWGQAENICSPRAFFLAPKRATASFDLETISWREHRIHTGQSFIVSTHWNGMFIGGSRPRAE